ncbi:MAG: 3-dehydroquinate synthase family protein [Sphingomicrobium sp.]
MTPRIAVGPLAAGLDLLTELAGGRPLPLVSDEFVFGLHGGPLRDRFDVRPLIVPRGEAAKDWAVLGTLLDRLAALDPDRSTPIVALGGGSVGDLAGLAASLFKRGCPIVHIPTTLLAQADSAIGGKTAIDFAGQKNLVGTFHQPMLVIADPALLATLDPRQLRAGLAEVIKYGVIDDPAFFAWCETHAAALLAGHVERQREAIAHCIAAKSRIVAGDVTDRSGKRALLNVGHSFAHAIEAERGLGAVLHGEAVAVGMVLALRFSAKLGHADPADAVRLAALLGKSGLPVSLAEIGMDGGGARLLPHLARDKKNERDGMTLVLARGIGQAFVQPAVPVEPLAAFLASA